VLTDGTKNLLCTKKRFFFVKKKIFLTVNSNSEAGRKVG
jgi:hypothetical protein